jgi:hypothetical protein
MTVGTGNEPELSGQRAHTGQEPELSMARPRCDTCGKPMIKQGDDWKCIRMACMRLRYGGQGMRTSPVHRGRLERDPEWFNAGKTTPAIHIMRVRSGMHPMGQPLLNDPNRPDAKCGNCIHHYINRMANDYHKCHLVDYTGGPASDIRVKWAACNRWQEQTDEDVNNIY